MQIFSYLFHAEMMIIILPLSVIYIWWRKLKLVFPYKIIILVLLDLYFIVKVFPLILYDLLKI